MWFVYFLKGFVAQPSILIGLFVMLGLIIQRKKLSEIVTSVFKTILGFLILGVGAGAIAGTLSNFFQPSFTNVFSLNGVIPNNDALAGAIFSMKSISSVGQLGSIIMVVALLMNMTFALTTRHKYIYLSGHVLFYMSIMLATVFFYGGLDFQNNAGDYAIALICGSALLGVYMVVAPAIAQKYTNAVTKTDKLAIGHTGNLSYALAGAIGAGLAKIVGANKIVDTEEIKFSDKLKFLRSSSVAMVLTMLLLYFSVMIPAGIMYEMDHSAHKWFATIFRPDDNNWLVTIIIQAFTFVAGAEVIIFGVRMFIGELIPAFRGVSDKIIKNSKPAVDCAVFFSYAPNAILIGFISSFIGGLIGFGISIGLNISEPKLAVIIPGIVPHFFLGATAGIFGNAKGGVWGAILGAFVNGIIISFVPIIFMAGDWGAIDKNGVPLSLGWGDTDYTIGVIPGLFGLISKWAILGSTIAIVALLYIETFLAKKFYPQRIKKTEEEVIIK